MELPRAQLAGHVAYGALFDHLAAPRPSPLSIDTVGEFLRCSMGLSAWKQYGASRWALRVNPSSGNLHPTEVYVVWNGRVCHYAPREHALEERCVLPGVPTPGPLLVGLTSIHWREAWKYGERAFRYCQHDVGHALGALQVAAALLGWRLRFLPEWSDDQIARLLGVDRAADHDVVEKETAECLVLVEIEDVDQSDPAPDAFTEAAQRAEWRGSPNRLSSNRVEWPLIDAIAATTVYPGGSPSRRPSSQSGQASRRSEGLLAERGSSPVSSARTLILKRRSAVAFDGASSMGREDFLRMLTRLLPPDPPWDLISWPPQVHLAIFAHRIDGLVPGLYAFLRDPAAVEQWRSALRPEYVWEAAAGDVPLWLLAPIDCRRIAQRLSCDQDIAGDGCFSLGMLARFAPALEEYGEWFYRRLFWECGLIGQMLYLEAEAAGLRATGIGCFYDDPVHSAIGLSGRDWQSLYHLAVGAPIDDARLTTEPGYAWDDPARN